MQEAMEQMTKAWMQQRIAAFFDTEIGGEFVDMAGNSVYTINPVDETYSIEVMNGFVIAGRRVQQGDTVQFDVDFNIIGGIA